MNKLLSLLVPIYNEASIIDAFFDQVLPILKGMEIDWEVICINDGSKDSSAEILTQWHQKEPRIKLIQLSRNFGKERALTAGLDLAKGDAVVPIDVDLQDPPELIPQMVELWSRGFDVVNAVRSKRATDSVAKRITARFFYRIINILTETKIPSNAGDFRLLSRRVCDELRNLRETHRFMKGLFAWVGFPTTTLYFERQRRSGGRSSWNYWKLWNFALEGIISFSTVPLKIASYLGLTTASISFIYACILIIKTLIFGDPVKGYPSMMTAILFFGGVQLMFIGIIGEYIARIHDEVKGRPIYIIESVSGFSPPEVEKARSL